jgi:excisionase family DNA binding protein
MSHTLPTTAGQAAAQSGDEQLLEAAEVAIKLRVSLSTVYRLARAGELRSHRFGKGVIRPRGLRIPESAVTDYLHSSVTIPVAEGIAS